MAGKNIVLCSDGTGNTAIKARGTNVFKLYEAVDIQGHKHDTTLKPQVAFYDDGVGTSRLAPLKLLTGAFGIGFSKNVRDLYTELVHVYEPGDHIYLFGFSRGAYTVRALSGLIQYCGILKNEELDNIPIDKRVKKCWKRFRKMAFKGLGERIKALWKRLLYKREPARDLSPQSKKPYDAHQASIEFVGVWDTVGAVGMPFEELRGLFNFFYPMRFSELKPSRCVNRACHALSIDDDRRTFKPELWDQAGASPNQVDQVWFAGVHSNVGGGYVKHGMSLVALDWMMAEAERCGLRFIERDREYVHTHQDVHDELYDARAGLGVYYRWEPRDIARFCKDHSIDLPKIHVSVFERIANSTDGYAPINIPERLQVVGTGGARPWPTPKSLEAITRQILSHQGSITSRGADRSLLDGMSRVITSGRLSYFIFVAVSILVVGSMGAFWFFPQYLDIVTQTCPYPIYAIGSIYVCLIVLVWGWSRIVDRQMWAEAQNHWQRHRQALRRIFSNNRSEQPSPATDDGQLGEALAKRVASDLVLK